MENIIREDGDYQLEIHSNDAYSKELAQEIENALEDVGIEIKNYSGEDVHYGTSVHNSPNISSCYTFRFKENVAAVDVHQACLWAGINEMYDIDYKCISLAYGEQLLWSSEVGWWRELWKKALKDLDKSK